MYKLRISSYDLNGTCIVQKIMDPQPGSSLNTYTAAGLAIESNFYRGWIEGTRGSLYARFVKQPDYWGTGLGICNISDAQMETVWGEPVMQADGKQYGGHMGLGYKGLDQEDLDIAVMAMRSKIMSVTNQCYVEGCSETDIFVAAALAEGSNLFADQLRILIKNYRKEPSSPNGMALNWNKYITDTPSRIHASYQINLFRNDVRLLHSYNADWYIPDINWADVNELIAQLKEPLNES